MILVEVINSPLDPFDNCVLISQAISIIVLGVSHVLFCWLGAVSWSKVMEEGCLLS